MSRTAPYPAPREAPASGPAARKVGAATWWGRLLAVLVVGGSVVLFLWFAVAHPLALAVAAALFGLGVASARFEPVRRALDASMRVYWRGTAWLAAALAPVLAARLLADGVTTVPPAAGFAALAAWLGIYLFCVSRVWSEGRRRELWRALRRFGRGAPFVAAFALAEVAIVLFATGAFMLSEHGVIRFGGGAGTGMFGPADSLDFFLWHFLDAVPALGVTETLRWEEPLTYTDGRVGALLLVFKIAVIVPIIGAFVAFARYGRDA